MVTREEWLVKAVDILTPVFTQDADTDVPDVRVSVGWPGGRGRKNNTIGQCWSGSCASDNVAQIFISPVLHDPVQVLNTLAHEIVHAAVGTDKGHGPAFRKVAVAIGLTGEMTATIANPEFEERLKEFAETLGEYPHAALVPSDGVKKQTTRMLKAECPDTGYTIRLTRKWIEEWGYPICPCCNTTMEGA